MGHFSNETFEQAQYRHYGETMKEAGSTFYIHAQQSHDALVNLTNTMLTMQNQINSQIHTQWRENQNPWYRAIWTECAELMDHYGWKWWKKQTPDPNQIWLEIVDIWHFSLSDLLQHHHGSLAELSQTIVKELSMPIITSSDSGADFLEAVEKLAQHCLASHRVNLPVFFNLMACARLDYLQLFQQYTGKNVLNKFRQDHGYKSGKYKKIWQGREDNIHLSEVMAQLDFEQPQVAENLYSALEKRYQMQPGSQSDKLSGNESLITESQLNDE